jgi:hypothetical protein
MDTEKQVIERLNQANNVLLTVSNNPSVDQLAACIGLSVALNKLGKHATAVFSGQIPSTIEFLRPDETIEKNTDSLRDFIISLDKAKADKLRYKVEDTVVKIFITPYKTSITDADLEFSQGDFNVDVVLAIGIHDQQDLDQAIVSHGRILHDATVVTINNQEGGNELGTIHWLSTEASSLSEMTALLATGLSKDILDEQIATALLTGIVAETDRFSNEKTSSNTMNISANLMAAGANQQLVASKLQEEDKPASKAPQENNNSSDDDNAQPQDDAHISTDGTLEINHDRDEEAVKDAAEKPPAVEEQQPETDTTPQEQASDARQNQNDSPPATSTRHYTRSADAPTEGSPFTSATDPGASSKAEPYIDPLALPPVLETPAVEQDRSKVTLHDLEKEVSSPHLTQAPVPPVITTESNPRIGEELDLDDLKRPSGIDEVVESSSEPVASVDAARDAVAAAMSGVSEPLAPVASLNAKPLGDPLRTQPTPTPMVVPDNSLPPLPQSPPVSNATGVVPPSDQLMTMPLPPTNPLQPQAQPEQQNNDPNSAPPVPPPIVPPFPGQ